MYDNKQDEIFILKGSNNLIDDVKGLYLDLFEKSRIKYNEKQTRSDRKIDDYFNHISNSDKTDLACEIIIELGDIDFWEDKSKDYRLKMNEVFKEQINYLEKIVPSFKVASAVAHFDEHSPHLHIVGVPFKEGNKNGMEIQVGKSAIFTKDSLKVIQDNMRENCIEVFKKVYSDDLVLKKKQKGKNHDIKSSEMDEYKIEEKDLRREIQKLEEIKTTNTEFIKNQEEEKIKIDSELKTKKKYNHRIILNDKASLLKENEELKQELSHKEWEYKTLKEDYNTLKSKIEYVLVAIKKVLNKMPNVIKEVIEVLFDNNQSIFTYEHNQLIKENQSRIKELEKNNSKKYDYNEKGRDRSREKKDYEL